MDPSRGTQEEEIEDEVEIEVEYEEVDPENAEGYTLVVENNRQSFVSQLNFGESPLASKSFDTAANNNQHHTVGMSFESGEYIEEVIEEESEEDYEEIVEESTEAETIEEIVEEDDDDLSPLPPADAKWSPGSAVLEDDNIVDESYNDPDIDEDIDDNWLYGSGRSDENQLGICLDVTDENEQELSSSLYDAMQLALGVLEERHGEIYAMPPSSLLPPLSSFGTNNKENHGTASSPSPRIEGEAKPPLGPHRDADNLQPTSDTSPKANESNGKDRMTERRKIGTSRKDYSELEAKQGLYHATKLAVDTLESRELEYYAKPPPGLFEKDDTPVKSNRKSRERTETLEKEVEDEDEEATKRLHSAMNLAFDTFESHQVDIYAKRPTDSPEDSHDPGRSDTSNDATLSDGPTSDEESDNQLQPSLGLLWAIRASVNVFYPLDYCVPAIASLKELLDKLQHETSNEQGTAKEIAESEPSRRGTISGERLARAIRTGTGRHALQDSVVQPPLTIRHGGSSENYFRTSSKYPQPEVHSLGDFSTDKENDPRMERVQRSPTTSDTRQRRDGGSIRVHGSTPGRQGTGSNSPTSVTQTNYVSVEDEMFTVQTTGSSLRGKTSQHSNPVAPLIGTPMIREGDEESQDTETKESFASDSQGSWFQPLNDEIQPGATTIPRNRYVKTKTTPKKKPTASKNMHSQPWDEEAQDYPWDEQLPPSLERASVIYETDFVVTPGWFQAQALKPLDTKSQPDNFLLVWISRIFLALLLTVPFGVGTYLAITKDDEEP